MSVYRHVCEKPVCYPGKVTGPDDTFGLRRQRRIITHWLETQQTTPHRNDWS